MCIDNVDIHSIVREIIVSRDRIEIFFKNPTIISCYLDMKDETIFIIFFVNINKI